MFAEASDAVAFAGALQSTLIGQPCPGGADVKLRMAVHTGDARRRDEGRYMGETLNRCARLRALAHPGQVLLSATTAGLVADRLSGGWFLRDLGLHKLRDLSRPVRRKSHYPTVLAMQNSLRKLLESVQRTQELADFLNEHMEAIRDHANRERVNRL